MNLDLSTLYDNPWQVREVYDPAYLEELAADIQQNGLLQPPLAREGVISEGGHVVLSYQLAFGHCRLRAYKLLHQQGVPGFETMPVDVRPLTDEQMADFAWTENEKRRDVTPIERMHAIKKQMETFGWTQAQVAERRGISEATVSNILRLGQLPEEIQTKVHAGELSERAALPLITYFNLPETVRDAAAKKKWIPDPVKNAHDGASSDDIRQAVNSVVQNVATSLKDIPITQVFMGEGILTATCQGCANLLTYNQQPYCGEQTHQCYNAKNELMEGQRREQASAETGLVFKIGAENIALTFSYGDGRFLPFARERHCENLRLHQPGYHVTPDEALDPQRFPGIRLVCCNPTGACACKQAMRDAEPEEPYTSSPEYLARQQAEKERKAQEDALISTFNTHLSQPTQAAYQALLAANDVRAWQLLLDNVSNAGWREIEAMTLEQCQAQLADEVIAPSTWGITRDTESTIERLNLKRARLGLEPLTLPEDENITPAEKLERRLARIESWLERCEEGEEEATPAAVRGNLVNLEKIQSEYAALPEDAQTLSAFNERLEAHLTGLSQWLDEYEAESDDDDADESLLEAYVGEAMPA